MPIQRTIDSALDGVPFKHTPTLLKLSGSNPCVLVALHGDNDQLTLLTYQVSAVDGATLITRLSDSGLAGAVMMQSPSLAPVRTNGYVTVICDGSGALQLTTWLIPASGQTITHMSDSGNLAMPIKHSPTIARVATDEVVTATVGHDNRIKLSRWGVSADLRLIQSGGDSDNNGPVSSTPAFVIGLHSQLVVVAYGNEEERLCLQLYRLTAGSQGDPFLEANSGTLAGKIKGTLRMTKLHNNLFATAVCTQQDRLKVILGHYSADGSTINWRGATDDEQADPITATPDIAFVQNGQFVTATRTESGGLKLTRWQYSNDGATITKLDDTGPVEQTHEIASVPCVIVRDNPSQDHWLTTAIRTSAGNLKLIAWA